MAQNDSDNVKLHATQTFAALGNKFSKLPRSKRLIIIGAVALLIYILGFMTCSVMNSVPNEGIIEKVAALPDAKNKCKFRYDRALEYAIMHECVFAKGTPGNGSKLVQRVNYCTCALEGVQMKKPYQKMFENNLVDFTFKIREENLCNEEKNIPTLEAEGDQGGNN
jgi:predicted nucleic acid-binding Zn finger protein